MGINIIDTSKYDEKGIKEKLSKMSDKKLLEYHKLSWSDYADSLNYGYCHSCDGYQDACGQFCPCQDHRLAEEELDKRRIKY